VREWFNPQEVLRLIEASARSKAAVRMLLAIFQFAVWHRLFIEGGGERPPARCNPLEFLD
jgi:asparagine synthase (glutamine-hydrolysing)